MASGRKHWRQRLNRLVSHWPRSSLTQAERRQLRKLSGRALGREWRLMGHQTRKWQVIPHTWAGPGLPSVFGGQQVRLLTGFEVVPVAPYRDVPIDALNHQVASNTVRHGHVIGRKSS